MQEARTNPRPKGALSPNAGAQNDKQTTDGIKSTADTSKPTISRTPSNTVSSIISEDGDEPKSSLKEPTPSKRSAPEALNGQPAAVKQKREEAPEEKPKKDLNRCHGCQEDYDLNAQDDEVICHFHTGMFHWPRATRIMSSISFLIVFKFLFCWLRPLAPPLVALFP